MIEIHDERVGDIAVIHAVPAGQYHRPLPTVFFCHGYTSSKEVYAYFAYALARAGFRAVLPDADRHGERFDGDETRRLASFWEILRSNIDELPQIKAHFERLGLIADGRIGVAGASMGGMTALGAFARFPWIRAAASLMGSGYYRSLAQTLYPPLDEEGEALSPAAFAARTAVLAEYELEGHLETIAGRPLLLWHGETDDVVPAADSQRLAAELRRQGADGRLTSLIESGVKHRITPLALSATADFSAANCDAPTGTMHGIAPLCAGCFGHCFMHVGGECQREFFQGQQGAESMIKGISNTAETARGLAGTMKARAELNSAAFSEMLGAADGKARQNKAHPLSRITAQTVQNMTALFASAPKAAATQTAKAGSLSFEQRATLEESAELLQARTDYLRMALQLHNPGKAFSAPTLLKL